jgi:hypothetical protein
MTRLAFLRAVWALTAGSSLRGVLPQRPDQGYNPPGTPVAPTQAAGVLRARRVIIFGTGPNAGLFVYSGAPHGPPSGNLIASITAPGVTVDPFGNTVVPGITSYDNVFGGISQLLGAVLTLFAGATKQATLGPAGLSDFNPSGALIYNLNVAKDAWFLYADTGSAVQGMLLVSAASANGTDQFGNLFLAGVTVYFLTGGTFMAFQMNGAGISTYTAASAAGPWNPQSSILPDINGNLIITSNNGRIDLAIGSVGGSTLRLPAADNPQVIAADGTTYRVCSRVFTATGQLVGTVAPAAVTGITGISVAARKYLIRGCVIVIQGGFSVSQAIDFAGPGVSQMNISWNCIEGASIFSSGVQGALGGNLTSGNVPNGTTGQLHFDGTLTFSSAGTFGMEASSFSGTGTWTLSGDSYLELLPV